jgi:carbamoyl-phosphate synthase small subunit
MTGRLILEDGTELIGKSYGAASPMSGEVVFATGMMGYPESLTDPSYKGQILVLTYPLIGNYGVPDRSLWESDHIMVSGLIVSDYIDTPSHFQSRTTLAQWFKNEGLPLLEIKDTRLLTQKIRDKGSMLGKIIFKEDIPQYDPNTENIVEQVSTKEISIQTPSNYSSNGVRRSQPSASNNKKQKIILLIDCGAKRNIQKALVKRGFTVITVPWDFDPLTKENQVKLQKVISNDSEKSHGIPDQVRDDRLFDGIVISNGPGDPKFADATIANAKKIMDKKIPLLGICLGHQILTLAAGGDTEKLKFGHRSQNQPCIMEGSDRCYITTQNHGFAVSKIPAGFKPWFTNANDGSNEGIKHSTLPFMSAQFHPEATPGPEDAEWIFDFFLKKIDEL